MAGPLTLCFRCGQCTDLAAMAGPLGEWLCYPCIELMLDRHRRESTHDSG